MSKDVPASCALLIRRKPKWLLIAAWAIESSSREW